MPFNCFCLVLYCTSMTTIVLYSFELNMHVSIKKNKNHSCVKDSLFYYLYITVWTCEKSRKHGHEAKTQEFHILIFKK